MPWDSDKSTASDPDSPNADEQVTAEEWDAMVADQKDHAARHEDGGSDVISVAVSQIQSFTSNVLNAISGSDISPGSVSTDYVGIGDSVTGDADVILYRDGSDAVRIGPDGVEERDSGMGAVVDAAFQQAFDIAYDDANDNSEPGAAKLIIAPGRYDCSDQPTIDLATSGTETIVEVEGHGAVVDGATIADIERHSLRGLTVENAPGNGFEFIGGRENTHSNLRAVNNDGHGFLYGGSEGAQVSNVNFSNLWAGQNGGHGHLIDSTNSNNWVNACQWSTPSARNNGDDGIQVDGGASNYNTFINPQCEGNSDTDAAIHIVAGNENSVVGGHTPSATDTSILAESDAAGLQVIGGRHPSGVEGAESYLNPRGDNQLGGGDTTISAGNLAISSNGSTYGLASESTVRVQWDSEANIGSAGNRFVVFVDQQDNIVGRLDGNGNLEIEGSVTEDADLGTL